MRGRKKKGERTWQNVPPVLQKAIRRYALSVKEMSWIGSRLADEYPPIEAEAKAAEQNLLIVLEELFKK